MIEMSFIPIPEQKIKRAPLFIYTTTNYIFPQYTLPWNNFFTGISRF